MVRIAQVFVESAVKSWLYQMSGDVWAEEKYRAEIWEGTSVFWPVQRIAGVDRPTGGDRIFCWYAKTVSASPGVCGWGVVLSYEEAIGRIAWRPVFPSDVLKMRPLFDRDVAKVIEQIRGKMPRGTMWPVVSSAADTLTERILVRAR